MFGYVWQQSQPTFVSPTSAVEQTRQALTNMQQVLKAAGATMSNVVKTTVMMANIDDFSAIDAAYRASCFLPKAETDDVCRRSLLP